MEDIGKELCERVKKALEERVSSNAFMVRLKDEIARGTATMRDTSLYSQTLGINLRRAIKEVVTPDELPDSTLYYNIAHSILEPLLRDTYEDVNAVCAEVQRKLDDKAGIHLAPQKADFPAERVRAAAGSASTRDTPAHGIEVLERTSENITAAFSDDYMKVNADFRSRAGLDTYIERRDDGKCCEWCSKIAGRYSYPDKAPRDIFRRHDNCGCTVEYVCSKGRQDVHTKRWRDDQGKAERIAYADGAEKPTKFSGKEAEELEKRLTNERKSGIMESEEVRGLEQAKKRDHKIYITDTAIERVDKVKPSDFSDMQADKMQQMHRKLLKIAKDENNSNEVLVITDLDFVSEVAIKGGEFKVSPASNPFAVSVIAHSERQSLVYLHNHPSTNNFSVGDIDTFCCESAIKTMTVVTNQGEVYVLNKTGKYSFELTREILTSIYESFPEGEIDDKDFVRKYLKECYKGGVEYVKGK